MDSFLTLYGDRLDEILGSADRSARFTILKRQRAINDAQLWFNLETECCQEIFSQVMTNGQAEYSLLSIITNPLYLRFSKQGPEIKADPGGGVTPTYYSGDLLARRDIAWLNRYRPGWRQATPATPEFYYTYRNGGQELIGFSPPPQILVGWTWTLSVPYLIRPNALVNDGDFPFTVAGTTLTDIEPWFDALYLYAGARLELLRKDKDAHDYLMQQAEARVADYYDRNRVPGGQTISVVRSYRQESTYRRTMIPGFGNRWDDPYK